MSEQPDQPEQPGRTESSEGIDDPDATVDIFTGQETEGMQEMQTSPVSRATEGGAPVDERPTQEQHAPQDTGTAGGDPIAGVTIDPEDAAQAASGDTGPENPGQHGDHGGPVQQGPGGSR